MKNKKILSFIIALVVTITSILCSYNEVKAVTNLTLPIWLLGVRVAIEESDTYQSAYESDWWSKFRQIVDQMAEGVGLKLSDSQKAILLPGYDPYQEIMKMWKAQNNNAEPTNKELGDFAVNMNIEQLNNITDNSISITSDYNTLLKSYLDYVKDQIGWYYVYSVNVQENATSWSNGTLYRALTDMLSAYQDDYYIITNVWKNKAFLLPKEGYALVQNSTSSTTPKCKPYNFNTWQPTTSTDFIVKVWDSTQEAFIDGTWSSPEYAYQNQPHAKRVPSLYVNMFGSSDTETWLCSSSTRQTYKVYKTINDMKSDNVSNGTSDYYVTQYYDQYINNNNQTYTINTENYNPITYGDINTWIEDNTPTGGQPPSPTDIDIYIRDFEPNTPSPTPNPDNPSGTVSGNGGVSTSAHATATATNGNVNVTVNNNPSITLGWPSLSGNGVSDNTVSGNTITGGVDNIFGFISYLGQVLGNLIKNVGNALVDLVEGIAEIIASIFEAIPNVFNDFMTGVFGWLPAELRALIVLAISAMLIVGIIKLIRG